MEISAQLAKAVILWTGWGRSAVPHRDDSLLISRFGNQEATELIAKIKALEADFYSSDANLTAETLAQMNAISIEQFKRKHPELPDEIAQAFAWCYTYDHK